jgi:uncharacterized membrane protein YfcA
MLLLAATLALTIGLTLGLLGGGGSILMVPMLVYVVGQDAKVAIASSLFVVGTTSLVGMSAHARAGRVRWAVGLFFGLAGMAGGFLGARLGKLVPGTVLLVAFGVMMLATSLAMMRGRKEAPGGALHPVKAILIGVLVGTVSGLVGAGGGFLVVPALVLFGGLGMNQAVGTSLLVIAMQALAGFAGNLGQVPLDWTLLGVVTAAAVGGSLVGVKLAHRAKPEVLRKAFAWLVLGMGAFLVAKQLPKEAVGAHAVPIAVGGVAVLFAVTQGLRRLRATAARSAADDAPATR